MTNSERATILKSYNIKIDDGAVFDSHQHAVEWVGRISGLLDYDPAIQAEFLNHARFIYPERISNDLRMTHIRAMHALIVRCVVELKNENSTKKTKQSIESGRDTVEPSWHKTTAGKLFWLLFIPIAVIVIGAFIIWKIGIRNGG
jgi:hypothetical protein